MIFIGKESGAHRTLYFWSQYGSVIVAVVDILLIFMFEVLHIPKLLQIKRTRATKLLLSSALCLVSSFI